MIRYIGEEVMIMAENGVSSYRCFLSDRMISLEEFIQTYSDAMVRFAYSFVRCSAEAEDIAADCISRFFLRSRRFSSEMQLRAYIMKSIRNRALDRLRKQNRDVPLDDLENVLGTGDPAQAYWVKERDRILYCCMQTLPRQYSLVLQLKFLEGFEGKQICTILGLSAKQVYNLLSRARVALKCELEKEGISYEDI